MANDFNLNEFKLKDPVRSIPDGLQEPVKDATPGFFSSLRNPMDLMLEESLPASIYQWMTGNTKKKQAQEKKDGKKDIKCAAVSKSGNRCKTKVVSGKSYCTVHEKVAQNIMGGKSQCKKMKKGGKRCGMQTSSKSGYCYYHD